MRENEFQSVQYVIEHVRTVANSKNENLWTRIMTPTWPVFLLQIAPKIIYIYLNFNFNFCYAQAL